MFTARIGRIGVMKLPVTVLSNRCSKDRHRATTFCWYVPASTSSSFTSRRWKEKADLYHLYSRGMNTSQSTPKGSLASLIRTAGGARWALIYCLTLTYLMRSATGTTDASCIQERRKNDAIPWSMTCTTGQQTPLEAMQHSLRTRPWTNPFHVRPEILPNQG